MRASLNHLITLAGYVTVKVGFGAKLNYGMPHGKTNSRRSGSIASMLALPFSPGFHFALTAFRD